MGAYFGIFIILLSSIVLDSIVAKVGEKSITYSDIIKEGELLNIENGQPFDTPLSPSLKQKIFELILMRHLLQKEAEVQAVTITVKQLDTKVSLYKGNRQMSAFLKRWGLSNINFRALVRTRMLSDKVTEHYIKRLEKGKNISQGSRSTALKEWVEKLKKRQKIVLYPIP
ncbi:hypothetical protein KAH37_00415 [bacterium]|nr:hypothetical protein [bacterium]